MAHALYRFEYQLESERGTEEDGGFLHMKRRKVVIQVMGNTVTAHQEEEYMNFDARTGESDRGWKSTEPTFHYLDFPRGGPLFIPTAESRDALQALEFRYLLRDGELSLKAAQNALNIMLPSICEKNEAFRLALGEIAPPRDKAAKKRPTRKKKKAPKKQSDSQAARAKRVAKRS